MLRFTTPEHLASLPERIRAQIERGLGGGPEAARIAAETVPGARSRLVQREQEDGAKLVEWIDSIVLMPTGLRPGLYFAHVANAGVAGGKVRGGILKGQGVRKGWPDYLLDLPLGPYHGLRLELKEENGDKPTREQLDTLARLEAVGFKCCVAWGFEDARRQIDEYLDLAR